MTDLLVSPGTPFAAVALAGVLLAALGLMRMERARLAWVGFRELPTRWGMTGRFALGQTAAVPLAGLLLLIAFAYHGRHTAAAGRHLAAPYRSRPAAWH